MPKQFGKTLDEIERLVADLKERQGITIEPLTQAIRDLRTHTESIEKIEADSDAIREEIIRPIRSDLAYGNKISKVGYNVGLIGLVASVLSLMPAILPFARGLGSSSSIAQKSSSDQSNRSKVIPPEHINGVSLTAKDSFLPLQRYRIGSSVAGKEVSFSLGKIDGESAAIFLYSGDHPVTAPLEPSNPLQRQMQIFPMPANDHGT